MEKSSNLTENFADDNLAIFKKVTQKSINALFLLTQWKV